MTYQEQAQELFDEFKNTEHALDRGLVIAQYVGEIMFASAITNPERYAAVREQLVEIVKVDWQQALDRQLEERATADGYETVEEYLSDARVILWNRMQRNGFSITLEDSGQYVRDANGDVDEAEGILLEDWS
jgi:hypothetical protein